MDFIDSINVVFITVSENCNLPHFLTAITNDWQSGGSLVRKEIIEYRKDTVERLVYFIARKRNIKIKTII